MNSTRGYKSSVTLAVLAASFFAGVAGAQHDPAVYKGKFTLPFETRWGGAVLPAGDYTFTVDSASLAAIVTVRAAREGKTVRMITAQGVSHHTGSGQSALIVVRNSSKGVVRGLQLAEIGIDFEYTMPHGTQLVAEAPQLFQRNRHFGGRKVRADPAADGWGGQFLEGCPPSEETACLQSRHNAAPITVAALLLQPSCS